LLVRYRVPPDPAIIAQVRRPGQGAGRHGRRVYLSFCAGYHLRLVDRDAWGGN
jgi:hypothetical protein